MFQMFKNIIFGITPEKVIDQARKLIEEADQMQAEDRRGISIFHGGCGKI